MSRFTAINLSGLSPPAIIETLDYEAIVQAMRDDLVARFPLIVGVIDLESEPARKLIEAFAYRELGLRARINDSARAVLSRMAATSIIWAHFLRQHGRRTRPTSASVVASSWRRKPSQSQDRKARTSIAR